MQKNFIGSTQWQSEANFVAEQISYLSAKFCPASKKSLVKHLTW